MAYTYAVLSGEKARKSAPAAADTTLATRSDAVSLAKRALLALQSLTAQLAARLQRFGCEVVVEACGVEDEDDRLVVVAEAQVRERQVRRCHRLLVQRCE